MKREEFCAALGAELKRLREHRGLTQEELGAKVGIHRTSMSRYELGADMPVMLFVRLIITMGASAGDVLNRVLRKERI